MTDQLMGTTELGAVVPELWANRTYEVLKTKLCFSDSISREYEGDISDLGDILHVSSVPEFAEADELAEGASADAIAVTITDTTLTINKRIVRDFILTKRAMKQSISKMDALGEMQAFSIRKKLENLTLAAIAPSTSAPDHDISFDSGTQLQLADLLEVQELLNTANVDEQGRQFKTGSAQFSDLFNITAYTSSDFRPSSAGSPMSSGQFAFPIAGFQLDWSSNIGNVGYGYHPSFMQIAAQEDMQVRVYDRGVTGERSERINCDMLCGYAQFDSSRVVKLS